MNQKLFIILKRFFLITIMVCFFRCDQDKSLRINEFQVLGSHNSYKQDIEPALLQLMQKETSLTYKELLYSHPSIKEQLETYGLRNLEIDVVYDPKGGHYSQPLGIGFLKNNGLAVEPYDTDQLMDQPGFKVLHVPDIDFRTSCLTLINCLEEIKTWSDKNPEHFPICITFNAKSEGVKRPGFTVPLEFDEMAFEAMEQEILLVFPADRIIKPDDVRGDYATLEKAVLAHQWPKLSAAKGKILLVLDEGGKKREAYIKGHPSLINRLMFVTANPGQAEAAFLIKNNPIRNHEDIKKWVTLGYMVRTRSDVGTFEARKGDYSRFEAALSSGAHFISSDFYWKDERLNNGFQIKFPEEDSIRKNPIFKSAQ